MELDEIVKRLERLDTEKRSDKAIIATLEKRIQELETANTKLTALITQQEDEISKVKSIRTKFERVDKELSQARLERKKELDTQDKFRRESEQELRQSLQLEINNLTKRVTSLYKDHDALLELKRNQKLRVEEEIRLNKSFEELKLHVDETLHLDENTRRGYQVSQETQRQEIKKVADLQALTSNLRKRNEDLKNKHELMEENIKKIENRLSEFQATENERRMMQNALMEKQALIQVDRDRTWKEWQARFDLYQKLGETFDSQLQEVESARRALKRSQDAFDEINQKIERRINEITEMQRLGEEKFRQEWISFKSEDQKRWTNYSLTQDEIQREINDQLSTTDERLISLEDLSNDLNDVVKMMLEDSQKKMQSLTSLFREWVDLTDKNRASLP
jgi:hypothetical protein